MTPPASNPTPVRLFYSYSHKDESYRDELEEHLSLLKRQGLIHSWHDRRISPGEEWQSAIDASLEAANVILFLVSAAFLASDYCYDRELKRALEKHEKGEARVIPIIIRPVDWSGAPFSKLQALPRDAKPVSTWPNRDEAWADVARRIRHAIEELINRPAQEPGTEKPAQRVEPEKAEPKKAEPEKAAASEAGAETLGKALLKWGSLSTVRTLKGHTKGVNTVAFSPDGSMLASGSGGIFFAGDCSVRLWRRSDGKLLRILEGHKEAVDWVAFLPDGKTLVSGSVRNVWLWRVSVGARLPTLASVSGSMFSLSPDGTILAARPVLPVSSRAIELWLWRVADGTHLCRIKPSEGVASEIGFYGTTFSPDGANLAAVSLRTAFLWRVADGKVLRTFKISEKESGSTSVAFSPDGKILAAGASSVWLWRVADGAVLYRLKENGADPDEQRATSVTFSPDGAILGSVHADKSMRIWHVPSGKLLGSLKGHSKKVNSLAFSPDGAMLASASDDQTVRLWAG